MQPQLPSPAAVLAAIDIYMQCAYGELIPSAVRSRLATLRSLSEQDFFVSPLFEKDDPTTPARFSARLGNRLYPHMKFVLDRSPDRTMFLFKADTHDTHCCPAPSHREYAAFLQLMDANQKIAQEIETRWAAAGIATFKTYLRDDLMRRQAEAGRTA